MPGIFVVNLAIVGKFKVFSKELVYLLTWLCTASKPQSLKAEALLGVTSQTELGLTISPLRRFSCESR